jgi:hypothetical protein
LFAKQRAEKNGEMKILFYFSHVGMECLFEKSEGKMFVKVNLCTQNENVESLFINFAAFFSSFLMLFEIDRHLMEIE